MIVRHDFSNLMRNWLTMRLLFILVFSTLYSLFSFSQEVEVSGVVFGPDGKKVEGALILDYHGKWLSDPTGEQGAFSFTGTVGDLFAIEKDGYELKWERVQAGGKLMKIVLDTKLQDIEEIVITQQNSEEALDLENVNIIDYQPLNNCILTLKREKRTYYIGLDSLNHAGVSYPLEIYKPRELFIDCMNNAYVLSADSAYQFYLLDNGIMVSEGVEIERFDQYIRPCVSKFDNRLVFEELSDLNKSYKLTLYDSTTATVIFNRFDQLGYQAAWEASVGAGMQTDPNYGDTLVDPVYLRRQQRRKVYGRNDVGEDFQRDLARDNDEFMRISKQTSDSLNKGPNTGNTNAWEAANNWSNTSDYAAAMASFMIFTQPLQIKTFQIGDYMAVVDYLTDSVMILDHQGYRLRVNDFILEDDIKNVVQDKATGYIYLFSMDKGNHKVYGLNVFTGSIYYLKNFGGRPYTENAIIYDGFLYYKVQSNNFYGIERVRLPKLTFFDEEE